MRAVARRGLLATALLVLQASTAWPQDRPLTRPGISGFVHSWWREREGLPGGAIYNITQTEDGYLWLATANGLVRFDGRRFVRWAPFGQPQAITGGVAGLSTDRDGAMWIGLTDGRTARIADGQLTFTPTPDASSTGIARGLQPAADGSLWVFHEPLGLRRLANGTWRGFADDPLANRIHSVWQDSKRRIWIGGENGAARWDQEGGRFERAGVSGKAVFGLAEDRDGRILAVSPESLEIVDGPDRGASVAFPQRIFPNAVHVDSTGHAWIGAIGSGLYRVAVSGGRRVLEHFGKLEGLTSDVVLCIFEDREGNIWVAGSNGLNRFRERKVQSISSLSYRSSVLGLALRATPDGTVWVGTSDGLVRFDTDGDTVIERETLLRDRAIYSIWPQGPDAPTVGLLGGQIVRFATHGRRLDSHTFTIPNAAGSAAIARQRSGLFWLAERSGGVIPWRPDHATSPERIDGPRLPNAVIVDDSDRTWVGFVDGGVSMFSERERRAYSSADGLSGGAIRTLYQDRTGAIWAGTDLGLARFNGQAFVTFTRAHGLPADAISEIIEDTDGNLWLGTAAGLVRIDRQNLQDIGAAASVKFNVTIYDANDGLAGVPSHFGNPGVTRTRDGRLWFLTQSGLAVVNPHRTSPPRPAPQVHVETMTADDVPLDLSSSLVLPPSTRTLSFDYAAPDLSVPEKVQFQYTLEGLENGWHDAGTRRQAFYNDLPPGSYRFRVVAGNNEGLWNEVGAATSFRIEPAFYQTIAFRASAGITLLLAAWALHRARLWQLARSLRAQFEARAAERAHIANELHDTLIQELSALSLSAEVADDQLPTEPEAAKTTLMSLRTRLQEIVRKGRASMTELRFGLVAADDLADALRSAARELRERYDGAFHLVVQGHPRPLHPLVGDEICRIAREAISNAFRHAGASRVDVELSFADDHVRVTVHDDGRGITPAVLEDGRQGHLGLHLMRDRARRIGGSLQMWSRAQEGTEVVLVVPARTAFQSSTAEERSAAGESSSPGR